MSGQTTSIKRAEFALPPPICKKLYEQRWRNAGALSERPTWRLRFASLTLAKAVSLVPFLFFKLTGRIAKNFLQSSRRSGSWATGAAASVSCMSVELCAVADERSKSVSSLSFLHSLHRCRRAHAQFEVFFSSREFLKGQAVLWPRGPETERAGCKFTGRTGETDCLTSCWPVPIDPLAGILVPCPQEISRFQDTCEPIGWSCM